MTNHLALSGSNLAFDPGSVVATVVNLGVLVGIIGLIIFALLMAYRFLRWNIDIEIWERKGNQVYYYGDDKGRRIQQREGDFVQFFKNKTHAFQFKPWPRSDYIIRKKLFGNKVKALLMDGELYFWTPKWNDDNGVYVSPMSVNQRIEYIQRDTLISKRYGPNAGKVMAYTALGLGAIITLAIILGFFQWQIMQTEIMEFTKHVDTFANVVQQASTAPTIPNAPN